MRRYDLLACGSQCNGIGLDIGKASQTYWIGEPVYQVEIRDLQGCDMAGR